VSWYRDEFKFFRSIYFIREWETFYIWFYKFNKNYKNIVFKIRFCVGASFFLAIFFIQPFVIIVCIFPSFKINCFGVKFLAFLHIRYKCFYEQNRSWDLSNTIYLLKTKNIIFESFISLKFVAINYFYIILFISCLFFNTRVLKFPKCQFIQISQKVIQKFSNHQ
jgi:hypothetical protein